MNVVMAEADRLVDGPLTLEVLVLYEDFATGLRAKQLLDHTAHQLPADAELKLELWRFELLREPALRQQALKRAVEAGVVFVSAHDQDLFPMALHDLLQEWCAQSGNKPRALVVSLDGAADHAPDTTRILEAWGTCERKAELDVFLHLGEARPEAIPTMEDIHRRAEMRTMVLDQALHRSESHPFRHWGINE